MPETVLTLEEGEIHVRGSGHGSPLSIRVVQTAANGDNRSSTHTAKVWTQADAERQPESPYAVGDIDWDETLAFSDGVVEVKAGNASEVFHLG